jgi:hypothetical protein
MQKRDPLAHRAVALEGFDVGGRIDLDSDRAAVAASCVNYGIHALYCVQSTSA